MKYNYYLDYDFNTFFDIPDLNKQLSVGSFNGKLLAAAIFYRINKERVKFDRSICEFHPLLGEFALLQTQKEKIYYFYRDENPIKVKYISTEPKDEDIKNLKKKYLPGFKWISEFIIDSPIFDPEDIKLWFEFIFYHGETIGTLPSGPPKEKIWTYNGFADYVVKILMNAPNHGKDVLNRDLRFFGCALLMYNRWTEDRKYYFPSIIGKLYFGNLK